MAFRVGSVIAGIPIATGSQRGILRLNGDVTGTADAVLLNPSLRDLVLGSLQATSPNFLGNPLSYFRRILNIVSDDAYELKDSDTGAILYCINPNGTTITLPATGIPLGDEVDVICATPGGVIFQPQDATVQLLLEPNGFDRLMHPASRGTLLRVPGTITTFQLNIIGQAGTSSGVVPGPGLLDTSGIGTFFAAWSVARRLSASYTANAGEIQTDDGRVVEIGFNDDGTTNTDQIVSACSSGSGGVTVNAKWRQVFDQTGNGINLVETDPTHQPYAFLNGQVCLDDKGNPTMYADGEARGMRSVAFGAYTGTTFTAIAVGQVPGIATTFSPSVVSMFGSSATDSSDSKGALLIGRNGGGSPIEEVMLFRNSAKRASQAITYDKLQQFVSIINDPNYTVEVDGATNSATVTIGALNATQLAIGHRGNAYQSAAGQCWTEILISKEAKTANQIGVIESDQQQGLQIDAPGTVSNPTFTLVSRDDFVGGTNDMSHFLIYDNAQATQYVANSWMAHNVDQATASDSTPVMRQKSFYNSGAGHREGSAVFYKGAANSAYSKGGRWRVRSRFPGAASCKGHGYVLLGWPSADPANWVQKGEPDFFETYASTGDKRSCGESNWHFNAAAIGTDHKLKAPAVSTGVLGTETHSLPADVARGNYGVDMSQWHVYEGIWKNNQYEEFWIDGVLRCHIDDTGTNSSYVMHDPQSVAMRVGWQWEGYGVSEANAQHGPFYLETEYWEFYDFA